MVTTTPAIQNSLHRIEIGEATSQEALATVRSILAMNYEDGPERIYRALAMVVSRSLQAHAFHDDGQVVEWSDLLRHAAAYTKSRGYLETGEQLRALADVYANGARFFELQPLEEVLQRSYVQEILEALRVRSGPVARAELKGCTASYDHVISTQLSVLAMHGVVKRTPPEGFDCVLELTAYGRHLCATLAPAEPGNPVLRSAPPSLAAR